MRKRYHKPVLYRQTALELAYNKRKRSKCSASSSHRYSSVSSRTNDSSPTITRTVTPIPLDFSELPDPFVPKDEWAVVNVSGQRFHINMEHVKLHHPKTLLGSNGIQILKNWMFFALFKILRRSSGTRNDLNILSTAIVVLLRCIEISELFTMFWL